MSGAKDMLERPQVMPEPVLVPVPADDPEKYFLECTQIVPEAIHEEYVRLPADLAFWNARYADAQQAYLDSKAELDILERELYMVVREDLEASGGKVTEKMVDSAMALSEVWKDARRALAKAEGEKHRLFGKLDAVRAKRDMLISLGAHLRAEMQGDPRLRDESREFGMKMGFHGG